MGLADTANLIVDLSLKGNFASQLKANQRALSGFDKAITSTQGRAYKAGQQIGTGIKAGALIAAGALGVLATQVTAGLYSLAKLDDVVAQTNAVLRSTKSVAGLTAESIRNLAEKYEGLNATIDDKVIQAGENLLLTFTNIRKQGFEPALAAALDMNQALGRGESGLTDTVRALGRALNDPAKGLVLLTRLGVNFTDAQKAQIKAALKNNDTLKAQSIILAELNKRFGGSFLAGGNTTTGKIAKIRDAIEDLQRALAAGLLPVLTKVADKLAVFLNDPKVGAQVAKIGRSLAALFSDKNLAEGGKILGSLFETAKVAAPVVGAAAKATLTAVKAAVSLFTSLPKEVQQLAIGAFAINKITGGLVTNVAGGLISAVLKQLVAGVVNVTGATVIVNGGVGVPGGPGNVIPLGPGPGQPEGFNLGKLIGSLTASAAANMEVANAANAAFSPAREQRFVELIKQGLTPGAALKQSLEEFRNGQIVEIDAIKSAGAASADAASRTKDDIVRAVAFGAGSMRDAIESSKIATVTAVEQLAAEQARLNDAASRTKDDLALAIRQLRFAPNAGGSGSSGGLPPGSGSVFVPTVTLDPSVIKDLRFDTRAERAGMKRAIIDALKQVRPTIFPGKLNDDLNAGLKTTNRNLVGVIGKVGAVRTAQVQSASRLGSKMDAVRRAAKLAGHESAAAIKDKDLSIRVTNRVSTVVDVRSIINGTSYVARYGRVATSTRLGVQ